MKEAREWKCSKYAEYFLMKGLSLGLQPGIPRLSANRLPFLFSGQFFHRLTSLASAWSISAHVQRGRVMEVYG